jgi:hypothetical protein
LHSTSESHSPDLPDADTEASASADASEPDTTSSYMNPTAHVSQATQHQSASSIATKGLQLVLEAVSRPRSSDASSRLQPQPSPEVKQWSSGCIKAYMGRFHDRWPILHSPTFEQEVNSIGLRSTAIIIGSWVQDETADNDLIFEIHSTLVKHLLDELVSSPLDYGESKILT